MTLTRLRKLRGRSTAELIDRGRQALRQWIEARGFGDVGEPTGQRLTSLIGDAGDAALTIQGPFFAIFGDREAGLGALRSVQAGFDEALRARADDVLEGRLDLLGYHAIPVTEPIDWSRDLLAGVRAPATHWSAIDYLDPAVAGDHKLVWELSRHQALVTLAQAWWSSRDPRYADACARRLESWIDANPPKLGIHWASSLEVSFRAIAWLWILALAGDVLPPALQRRMLGVLAISGRHIEQYLSTWFSPNTHLTGEALGLFYLGTALPQCPDAARWRQHGAEILLAWLERHVRPDGSYVEQSTWYHRYTTDFYLHFLILAERSAFPVRDRVERPLAQLLEHLAWITRPDGSMPLIGDDDGGRLLFLEASTAHATRAPLSVGSALLKRADLAAVAGAPTEELVWLLGARGLRTFRNLKAAVPDEASRAFVHGGMHIMRSGWRPDASVATVDAGPHGFLNAAHAHADALSIDLTIAGAPVFVDPGTFTYTMSPEWRDRLRETASHNAATVDGCGSATPSGPFQWSTRVNAHCDAWFDGGDAVLFSGTHDGFERLRPAVRYRRSVAFVRPALWIVRDEIEADGEHELAVHWQCAPGVEVDTHDGAMSLRVGNHGPITLRVAEPDAEWTISEGWVAPTYGSRTPAVHLRCVRRGLARLCLTSVICSGVPLTRVAGGDVRGGMGAVAITWGDRDGVVATRSASPDPRLSTDAAVCFIERRAGVAPRVVAADVSRLQVHGESLLDSTTRLAGVSLGTEAGAESLASRVPSVPPGSS